MHAATHAVSGVLTDHFKAMFLDMRLDSRRNVSSAMANRHLGYPRKERFAGHINQFLGIWADLAHPNGNGRITDKSLMHRSTINADDIPRFENSLTGDTVHQFIIDRDRSLGRVRIRPRNANEGRLGIMCLQNRGRSLVDLRGANPRLYNGKRRCECPGVDLSRHTHALQLSTTLEHDTTLCHRQSPTSAFKSATIAFVTSSIDWSPST